MAEGNNEHFREETLSREERVKEINDITGYVFNDPILLEHAFTHPSFKEVGDESRYSFERLEYLGDAVLGLMVAEHYYLNYPDIKPGTLTQLRAANVDSEKLARVALEHNLYKFLRHNIQHFAVRIKNLMGDVAAFPGHSSGLVKATKVLADLVESFIGAIYLDSNKSVETTWLIVSKLLKPTTSPENLIPNPVAKLNETCQMYGLKLDTEDSWITSREFGFVANGVLVGSGKCDDSKKTAKTLAAQNAFDRDVLKKLCEQNQYIVDRRNSRSYL